MNALARLVAQGARQMWRDRSGMAAIETVMIAPVAVFILALSIESGHYMYAEHQVLKGVRDAARYAGRLPLSTWNCAAETAEADMPDSSAKVSIVNLAVYGNLEGSGRPRVWSWNTEPQYEEIQVRFACKAKSTGIYTGLNVYPQIAVIGKPNYPSLLLTLGGFNNDMKLYARQQAIGIGI